MKLNRKLERSKTEVANFRSELQAVTRRMEKSETEVAKGRSELESVKSELEHLKDKMIFYRDVLPTGFKYFFNNVLDVKFMEATQTSFDGKSHNSEKNLDTFCSFSESEQLSGVKIFVSHEHRVYSNDEWKAENWISLDIEKTANTYSVEVRVAQKPRVFWEVA